MTNAVVSSPTNTLTFALEKSEAETPQIYRLRKSFAAVQLQETGKGRIVFLPEGAELWITGSSRFDRCCEVAYKDERYHIFRIDLLGPWSTPVKSCRNAPPRAKSVGAHA